MIRLKILNKSSNATDSDIIQELKKIKDGEPLLQGGIFDTLYNYVTYAGQTLVLNGKKGPVILQVEHDDVLMNLSMDEYTWHLESDESLISLTLLVRDSESYHALPFSFNKKDRDATETLGKIRSRKKLDVCFLSILYGEIIKKDYQTFVIPRAVASRM